MALEQLEPLLYLPDDTSFYADVGDEFHAARLAWCAAGLVGLVLLAYLPVIWMGGFIWQDDWHVSNNVLLWSWTGLARTWSHGLGGSYHPLAQTLLWIEHHFRGHADRLPPGQRVAPRDELRPFMDVIASPGDACGVARCCAVRPASRAGSDGCVDEPAISSSLCRALHGIGLGVSAT